MTRRPGAAALAAVLLAGAALLTACGPGADHGRAAPGASDSAQVGDLQQKLDAAESAAAEADSDTAADDG
ncbi:hypothetical protein ACFP3U_00890 [Kitasatospora misakiensis]|uniref:Uncharacterized protein n=1 Tax=Kitasatospora misakiensis TaxID=67330 RepID=A0ABW0WZ72_9ACTN